MSTETIPSIKLLGLDGGGTKTRCLLAEVTSDSFRILGEGLAGASNPRAIGILAACTAIDQAIQKAFEDAKLPREKVAACAMGLAGAGERSTQQVIAEWVTDQNIASKSRVEPDYQLVLAAGSETGCGIGLIAGTGSLAFGVDTEGRFTRAGGLGYLLGDEGSGFAIGRDAVRFAAEERNHSAENLEFLQQIFGHFKAPSAQALISHIYKQADPKATLASAAPIVLTAAKEQNAPAAVKILQTAGEALAAMVVDVANDLDWSDTLFPFAITGGILLNADLVKQSMLESLKAQGLQPEVTSVSDPTEGAVLMARRLL